MKEHYQILEVSSNANQAEIKSAYLAKLREFPAHTHPEEFKAVRKAYEKLKNLQHNDAQDFFEPGIIEANLDPETIYSIKQKALARLELTHEAILKLTF